MSWGTELWDQYESIAGHTQRGIDYLERYGHFLRDRCTIEEEYATKLRRLSKNYQPKKRDEEEYQFSSCRAFVAMLNEINDLAGQHELIAENLTDLIIVEMVKLVKDLKEERKRYLQDGARIQTKLQESLCQLDKVKKCYEKAYRDAEKAQENFQKADADLNLSRADVEKARALAALKNSQSEDSKNEYASQLQKTNDLQHQHYTVRMPEIFQKLQELDERRISQTRQYMKQSVETERNVNPIILRCLDGIDKAADSIDPTEDSKLVIERYKSGFEPPCDIPFEDLTVHKSEHQTPNGPNSISSIKTESLTLKGTLSASKLKKRGGLFAIFGSNKNNSFEFKDDFSDLPPNQRRKKLLQKIEQISAQIQQETAARDGLMKMKGVYEQNPALGDPLSVEGQLTDNGHRLDKLRQELHKFQTYLSEVEGRALTPAAQHRNRNSISDDSLSRSASDSSVSNPPNNRTANNIPAPTTNGRDSHAEAMLNATLAVAEDYDDQVDGEFYDLEPLPVLGSCKALYQFDAQSEGSIPMFEGEELQVIELDQGDGWTRVRRDNNDEGFVPTSYIECHLYSNVC